MSAKPKGRFPRCELNFGYFLYFLIFLLFSNLGISQTTIWSEDFNGYSDGTENGSGIGPSANDWTTDRPGRLNIQSGRLRGRNLDAESTWATDPINIYGYTSVSFSLDVDTQSDTSQFEQGTDYFIGEYRIGGSGAWTEFDVVIDKQELPIGPSYREKFLGFFDS